MRSDQKKRRVRLWQAGVSLVAQTSPLRREPARISQKNDFSQ
jgi:hypothetical protein